MALDSCLIRLFVDNEKLATQQAIDCQPLPLSVSYSLLCLLYLRVLAYLFDEVSTEGVRSDMICTYFVSFEMISLISSKHYPNIVWSTTGITNIPNNFRTRLVVPDDDSAKGDPSRLEPPPIYNDDVGCIVGENGVAGGDVAVSVVELGDGGVPVVELEEEHIIPCLLPSSM